MSQLKPQRSPAEGPQIARRKSKDITGNAGGRGTKNQGEESEAEVVPSLGQGIS